jgi:hypothetical protein
MPITVLSLALSITPKAPWQDFYTLSGETRFSTFDLSTIADDWFNNFWFF